MALIKCPECGGQVSDKANTCPHCGYDVASYVNSVVECPECGAQVSLEAETCPNCGYVLSGTVKEVVSSEPVATTTAKLVRTPNTAFSNTVTASTASTRQLYDVMLVDYENNIFSTASALKNVIDCTYAEAVKLLGSLPTYLYNDISYDDAVYICRQCQNLGMRTALYDPNNKVTYYAPAGYSRALPVVTHVVRRPYVRTRIVHREYVTPLRAPARRPAAHTQPVHHDPRNGHNGGPGHRH